MLNTTWQKWRGLLAIEASPASHRERLISALGAGIAIIVVYAICRSLIAPTQALFMAAPLGATALLLFAVPHSPFSQPWQVMGGYAISTTIGVACASFLPNEMLAAGLAVGLSVAAMYYLRCIHPPCGAAALMTVIGGDAIHALGFAFVLVPVLLNALLIILVATAFNAFFPWRRYPAFLSRGLAKKAPGMEERRAIPHEDFVYALTEMESFIDVSEEDLLRIYALATGSHAKASGKN